MKSSRDERPFVPTTVYITSNEMRGIMMCINNILIGCFPKMY